MEGHSHQLHSKLTSIAFQVQASISSTIISLKQSPVSGSWPPNRYTRSPMAVSEAPERGNSWLQHRHEQNRLYKFGVFVFGQFVELKLRRETELCSKKRNCDWHVHLLAKLYLGNLHPRLTQAHPGKYSGLDHIL